jgi:hypothetical protein
MLSPGQSLWRSIEPECISIIYFVLLGDLVSPVQGFNVFNASIFLSESRNIVSIGKKTKSMCTETDRGADSMKTSAYLSVMPFRNISPFDWLIKPSANSMSDAINLPLGFNIIAV